MCPDDAALRSGDVIWLYCADNGVLVNRRVQYTESIRHPARLGWMGDGDDADGEEARTARVGEKAGNA